MGGYAVKNLKEDVEDQAVKHGFSPAMEVHFAREDLGCEQTGISYQRFAPGVRQPFGHHHDTQEELYVVTGGSGQIKLGDDLVDLRRWDAVRVAGPVVRAFAAGPDGLEILAFGPRGLDDAQTVPSPWEA